MKKYQICNRCVMDNTSDDLILFDEIGYCNYCNDALRRMKTTYYPNEQGEKKIEEMVKQIKQNGKDKEYDCLMGISGGLDSSYLAYLGYKWGLRILAVHIDDGFDTDIAKKNIDKLCEKANIQLLIEKPNADQFNDLTKAYILAEVPNIAIPQDNILFGCLYKYAKKYKVNYFLSGSNFSLESITQRGNSYNPYDIVNIKDIHKKFGLKPMNELPLISYPKRIIDRYLYNIITLKPLDYIDYNKQKAIHELEEFCGFNYYGSKHLENSFTLFVQLYWLNKKFGVDKRHAHLSSMIISNQLTRESALIELQKESYNKFEMEKTIELVLNKLSIDKDLFNEIIQNSGKQHSQFKTSKTDKIIIKLMEKR
ncbi:MAG: N-acetyl sugar amidotransferase [Saccharofermentanales bacterium]